MTAPLDRSNRWTVGFDVAVRVPGSKSITNRALVCAALADGTSVLEGALCGGRHRGDGRMSPMRSASAFASTCRSERIRVDGCNGELPAATAASRRPAVRDDGAVRGARRRTGHGRYEIDGGAPMRRRPMGPLIDALRSLGVSVEEHRRTRTSSVGDRQRRRRRRAR